MHKQPTLTKKNSKPQEQLQDLLTCQICYTLAKKIMMCPHCSKIYCQPCIKKSLFIKSECPHCRKIIKDFHSMANCQRFVNEVKGIVEEVLKEKQKENFRCESHDVPLNYFCLQCERSVCCECKMFGDHKQHELVQVEKKYQQKYQKIRSMLAELKVSVREKQQLISKFQHLLTEKNDNFRQETSNVSSLEKSCQEWYGKQRRAKKEEQKEDTQKLENILEKTNQMRKNLRSQYSRLKKEGKYSFSEFQQERIQKSVSDFNAETQKVRENFLETKSILKELIPGYICQTFTVENFSKVQREAKSIIYSEPVEILGCRWKLKVYPNGSESVEGKYLSIYVMMVQNEGWKMSSTAKDTNESKKQLNLYEYFIQISADDNPNLENGSLRAKQSPNKESLDRVEGKVPSGKRLTREYSSTFEPGQSWGYIKFIELKELQAGGYLINDRLNIKFSIRKPDYFKYYQALQTQLNQIQSESNSKEQFSDSKIPKETHLQEPATEASIKNTSSEYLQTQSH